MTNDDIAVPLDLFSVEENIMKAWATVDDIQTIYENMDNLTHAELSNAILGVIALGGLRFEKLMAAYEVVMEQRSLNESEMKGVKQFHDDLNAADKIYTDLAAKEKNDRDNMRRLQKSLNMWGEEV